MKVITTPSKTQTTTTTMHPDTWHYVNKYGAERKKVFLDVLLKHLALEQWPVPGTPVESCSATVLNITVSACRCLSRPQAMLQGEGGNRSFEQT